MEGASDYDADIEEAGMTTMTSHRGSPSQVTEAAQPVPASPLDAEDLRARVDRALAALLDRELTALGFLGTDAGPVTEALTRFALEGGKRLRPAFVWWGYRGAGGPATGPEADATILASCSVELLHVCALIHDDIMDGSEVRRGRPARRPPGRRPAGLQPAPLGADGRPVPGPGRGPPGRPRRGRRPPGPDLQVGQVHHRAAAAPGPRPGRRRARPDRRLLGLRAAAGRGLPAPRRHPRRVRRARGHRQAGRGRPARGQGDLPGP